MNEHRRALLLLVACGVLWSTGGVLIKFVDWHAGAIWSARSLFTVLLLYAVRRPSFARIQKAEWQAAVAVAATTGLFIAANKLTTAANAILIQYSAPVWVALLGHWFLGERASRLDWITTVLVLGGVTLFFFDQLSLDYVVGNFVALASGVAFAFATLALRKVATRENSEPLRPIILGNALSVVLGLPFWFAAPLPDATAWAAIAALGVFQLGVSYLCYVAAIRHATAMEVILIPVIEPIVSPLWVAIFFAEWPGPTSLIGGGIVVGAVTLRATKQAPANNGPPDPT